jgi:hypothetical protein
MSDTRNGSKRDLNLYERIRARLAPLGGVDLELPPREPGRDPPDFDTADYDQPPTDRLGGVYAESDALRAKGLVRDEEDDA